MCLCQILVLLCTCFAMSTKMAANCKPPIGWGCFIKKKTRAETVRENPKTPTESFLLKRVWIYSKKKCMVLLAKDFSLETIVLMHYKQPHYDLRINIITNQS